MVTNICSMRKQKPSTKHDVFQAIADPNRRRILQILGQGEQSVVELTRHFQVSRPAISKHLRILREAALVRETKVGKYTYYRFAPEPLETVVEWMKTFDRFWSDNLDSLKQLLEQGE